MPSIRLHDLRHFWLVLLPVAAGCVFACGSSFTAVDAVGKAGAKIGTDTPVIDSWENACGELHNLNPTYESLQAAIRNKYSDAGVAGDPCVQWKSSSEKIKQIALALAAYGTKLSAVANATDVSIGDGGAAAIAAIGKSGWTADSTNSRIVTAVVNLFSKAYRKEELNSIVAAQANVVKDAVDELDQAASIAHDEMSLVANSLQSAQKAEEIQALKRLSQDGGSLPILTGVILEAIARMQEDVTDQSASVDALRAGVDAFGKAHAQLVANKDHLDTDDTLKAVVAALGSIVPRGDAGHD
jgi:hypothetical protein